MLKVCVIGASGFTGAELLRICSAHPVFEVVSATGDSMAGGTIADLYPSLAAAYPTQEFVTYEKALKSGFDLAFCALPHGVAQSVVGELREQVPIIVDLSADFRLHDPDLYPKWYNRVHTAPELLEDFVFGLPELFRQELRTAELIASPGCYVTAASLALAPLVAAGVAEPTGIIVNAASGVSGAGRAAKPQTTFCTVDENFTAYGLLKHRHTPEIEMVIARHAGIDRVEVLFTPHLAPMNRGILATCYARPRSSGGMDSVGTSEILGLLEKAYADEPFVVVDERLPSTKATLGSNSVHITARADDRTGWLVVIAALDNLVKGASGQAVQCANVALGISETAGLAKVGVYP